MIETVFYQLLEYVVAPIGLMIFTFYVKSEKTNELKEFKFSTNAIESLFIASYCHLLYYFNLTAHQHINGMHTYCNDQFACLLCSISGLLTIFIYKYLYLKFDGHNLEKIIKYINRTAVILMILLACIIVNTNMKCSNYIWTWSIFDFNHKFFEIINYIFTINNILFIPSIILLARMIITNRPIIVNSSLKSYIDNSHKSNYDNNIKNMIDISEDLNAAIEIRVNSYARLANYYLQLKNYYKGLDSIINAKRLAISANYPEHQLFGIRKLKIELNCLLEQKNEAKQEILEVMESRNRASENNRPFYDLWIKKLSDVLCN